MSACHVEAFREDGSRRWGWQCFTCPDESVAWFGSPQEAERGGEHHRVEVATQQLIDDGELP